ncbi:MAG: hypothetical protein ABI679_09160 [Gemmatimonadota bacterium]
MNRRALLFVYLVVAWPAGAVCQQPAAAPAPSPAINVVINDSANIMMRQGLADALQAHGREAVASLRAIDTTRLAERYRPTRVCMLDRLDARRMPPSAIPDRFLSDILGIYREYWLRSLRAEHSPPDNDAWLLASLNARVSREGGPSAATLDDLEPVLEAMILTLGYHPLLGLTSPLRELMLWKTETETRYNVKLPESTQRVTVVFMDDFASLGWAGFATCDRHHSGGWTKPDRLYAVRSAYDVDSEEFRVSYLAHEGQHFSDNHRFPGLEDQQELEYRAKLVELAVGKASVYDLLESFAGNTGDDRTVPHSYANGRVVRDLMKRVPFQGTRPAWRGVSVDRINKVAATLLREDTARLEKEPSLKPR